MLFILHLSNCLESLREKSEKDQQSRLQDMSQSGVYPQVEQLRKASSEETNPMKKDRSTLLIPVSPVEASPAFTPQAWQFA